MNVGIIGHAADKFTTETEAKAKQIIRGIIWAGDTRGNDTLVSGRCHLGGVDVWAEEIATSLTMKTLIFPAKKHTWDGPGGYKERNLQIAESSDVVHVVVVQVLPPGYKGMKFNECYHCARNNLGCKDQHVKSGACWTALRSKRHIWHVVKEEVK